MTTPILFCIPYAGGAPSAFRAWQAIAGHRLDVRAVALPGREARFLEPPDVNVAQLADDIAGQAGGRPYAIFGHSMGGRLGFEVVRELRRRGEGLPLALYVSACRAPDTVEPLSELARADDEALFARLTELGGMPREILDDPEMRELLLPVFRADFAWLDTYVYEREAPLEVPITAFAGRDDPSIDPGLVDGWRRESTAGFELRTEPGGHFFVHERAPQILDAICHDLGRQPRHLLPLGGTGWSVWKDAVLRSTGFPADGLARFSAPECARAADAFLAGELDEETFAKTLAAALAAGSEDACELAADPLFREAVTWQNRTALAALDGLVKGGPGQKRNNKRREREQIILKYWQRYTAKNDSVGFFGPVTWAGIRADGPAVTAEPGPGLLASRRVRFEDWALRALAAKLAEDPAVRRGYPPVLQPHLTLAGRKLLRPAFPPVPISAAEEAVLSRCDGRPAVEIAGELIGAAGFRSPDDVYLTLDMLAERELIDWTGNVPVTEEAERHVHKLLTRAGHAGALAVFKDLRAARDRVADAAGDPDELLAALLALNDRFTSVVGETVRRPGQTYAGRGLLYEDTTRDLRVVFGGQLLDDLAEPMALMLQAARWLTVELVRVYGDALRELFDELRADTEGEVLLADVWYLAQGALFGSARRPVDEVAAGFAARWRAVFGLDDLPEDASEVRLTAAELAGVVARTFPAARPGWWAGRLHAPDLQLCAPDADAVNRGDYTVVLGEMHAAWPTFDTWVFTGAHPDPGALADALDADIGPNRLAPLYPDTWPLHTGRVSRALAGPGLRRLGWTAAPGADPATILPATSIQVREVGGDLVAVAPDGQRWPLVEVFSELLAIHAVDGFKLAAAGGHTPRISIGRLVVARETWRTTAGESGLTEVTGERERYLAVRRWRLALGLPEHVFVKLSSEIKPTYVDLTSPFYASMLCMMLRSAQARAGGGVKVTITELLPGPGQAWLPDARGRGYFNELRLHLVDPATPGGLA
ncbi:thioesterase domain-containing protein [Nonomuraea sp. NPDC050547]|uniref:thioesterase domain-containing protein n=1 Tax=Nonomuraea sp. NPDC050547 TaxID=3364368 RepID=UPI0037B6272D